jgi:hypothetical protein
VSTAYCSTNRPTRRTRQMIKHLAWHREAGHDVPDGLKRTLRLRRQRLGDRATATAVSFPPRNRNGSNAQLPRYPVPCHGCQADS